MTIKIKTAAEIEKMRIAGKLAADVLEFIAPHVKAGISTAELDRLMHEYMIHEQGTTPATLNYGGYPFASCISLNKVICHGTPDPQEILKNGDILNIDVTVIKDGWFGDNSMMFEVGQVKPFARRLCDVARECLWLGIEQVKPNNTLYDVADAIESHAKSHNFSVVKEYCGHGIGDAFHEPPQVLHYAAIELKEIVLKPGMTFTIEPMINQGKPDTKVLKKDHLKHPKNQHPPIYTKDNKLSAQWEHTLVVTDTGYEVLTLRTDEKPFLPNNHG